jgi:hypothetical protein
VANNWLTPLAGTGEPGPLAANGTPALTTPLDNTCGATVDHHGNVLLTDDQYGLVRVVAHSTGWFYQQHMTKGDVYTVAGGGDGKYLGNGLKATKARLAIPNQLAVDSAGNLLIAGGNTLRVVAESTGNFYGHAMTAGHIYGIAGGGTSDYASGLPATQVELQSLSGVAIDAAGNLVIPDTVNRRIRVVAAKTGTFYGQAMIAGDIYTVAGNGVPGLANDGRLATSAELSAPAGMALNAAGDLVFADSDNNRIREVTG